MIEENIQSEEITIPRTKGQAESLKQKEAFEYYYSLGEKRTGDLVAKRFKCTARTVYEWSRRWNWAERVIQRDIEVGRALAQRNTSAVIDEKANYRKMIKMSLVSFLNDLRAGTVKVRNISDFERLVKLDLTLMGEVSEIVQNNNENSMTPEDRELLKKYTEATLKNMEQVLNSEE